MDIEKFNDHDLLLFYDTEVNKLRDLLKNHSEESFAIKFRCKNISESGIIILDRYGNTLTSIFQGEPSQILIKNVLFEKINTKITNILKMCRFCLEYIIWEFEHNKENFREEMCFGKYVSLALLCKVLFFQGDFLEFSIILERLIYEENEVEQVLELKKRYSYVFEYLKSWELYNSETLQFKNGLYDQNKTIPKDYFNKEIRLKYLISSLFKEKNQLQSNQEKYFSIIEEVCHCIKKLDEQNFDRKSEIKNEDKKFEFLKRFSVLRLSSNYFHKKLFDINKKISLNIQQNYLKNSRFLLNDIFDKQINFYVKEKNIFLFLELVCSNLGIKVEIKNTNFLELFGSLELILNEVKTSWPNLTNRTDFKGMSDKRKRVRTTIDNEILNTQTIDEFTYESKSNINNSLQLIIFELISNNTMTFPIYTDKQYKAWIHTIPFYCCNLILSFLNKKEIHGDEAFSQNLNSSFLSIEQFDEMINREINDKISDIDSSFDFIKPNIKFLEIDEIFSYLKSDCCEIIFETNEIQTTFISIFVEKILPYINNYLLVCNLLLNKFRRVIAFNLNKEIKNLVEKLNQLLFIITRILFIYCTEIIKYLNFSLALEYTKKIEFEQSINIKDRFLTINSSIEQQDGTSWVNQTYKLYTFLPYLNFETRMKAISVIYNMAKTSLIFFIIINNLRSEFNTESLELFFQELNFNFKSILDIYIMIKEKFQLRNLNEEYFPTKILFILFNLLKIPLVSIYYENDFLITIEEDLPQLTEYHGLLKSILKLSSNFEYKIYNNKTNNGHIYKYTENIISNKNIKLIFEKLRVWNFMIEAYKKFPNKNPEDMLMNFSKFLENIYAEHKILKNMKYNEKKEGSFIDFLLLRHINSTLKIYFNVFADSLVLSIINEFKKFISSLLSTINEFLSKEIQSLVLKSGQFLSVIANITKIFVGLSEKFEIFSHINQLNLKDFQDKLILTIILAINCIHKLFTSYLSSNKINVLLVKYLMTFLIVTFDVYQNVTLFTKVSPNCIMNFFRYLIYLECSFEIVDEYKEIKENRSSKLDEDNLKRHIYNNFCPWYSFIEHIKDDHVCKSEFRVYFNNISRKELNETFNIYNIKILLLDKLVKYSLIYNFSSCISNSFSEIIKFVEIYNPNKCFENWNKTYTECRSFLKQYLTNIDSSSSIKIFEDNLKKHLILPEQETEYLELFAILLQLLYGIPVCPLPSIPFNKLPIYNQMLIFDQINKITINKRDELENQLIFNQESSNLIDYFKFIIFDKISRFKNDAIHQFIFKEYLTPYSPLIILSCNIFESLINCTSLTEKQYSDSRVSFYSSIIGLIEKLVFDCKYINNEEILFENNFTWDVISSPVIFPSFMQILYKENLNLDGNQTLNNFFKKHFVEINDISSILYNGNTSDSFLNFYDNIHVLPLSVKYIDISQDNIPTHNKTITRELNSEEFISMNNILMLKSHLKNALFTTSVEPLLYCKYYLAYYLHKLMICNCSISFLKKEKIFDKIFVKLEENINIFLSKNNTRIDHALINNITWESGIEKYLPFNFLNHCFISCIPILYSERKSSMWYPGKFGITSYSSLNSYSTLFSRRNIKTLFKYLIWINMNAFLSKDFDIKIITSCSNILKLIICEYDDRDSLESEINSEYSFILRRLIAQATFLFEIESNYYYNLLIHNKERNMFSNYIFQILSINFDQICIKLIYSKGFYKSTNIRYILIQNYIMKNRNQKHSIYFKPKSYENGFLKSVIQDVFLIRKKIFLEYIPLMNNLKINCFDFHSNDLDKINNYIWLPSLIESKLRFKYAKIEISSYLNDSVLSQEKLNNSINYLKQSYFLSIESLYICYLILYGRKELICNFFESIQDFRDNDFEQLIHSFKLKISKIYNTFYNIFINKFSEKYPYCTIITRIPHELDISEIENIQISVSNLNSNLISVLFYFYKSFTNFQSIKQFMIILFANKDILNLNENKVLELFKLLRLDYSNIIPENLLQNPISFFIHELIFDEIDTAQSSLKKNKLTHIVLPPVTYQNFSYFSIFNLILLNNHSSSLISYFQRIFLSNKKVLNLWGLENNKLCVDHYIGLYFRRQRKYIYSKYKFLFLPSVFALICKDEIFSNITSILLSINNNSPLLYKNLHIIDINNFSGNLLGIYFIFHYILSTNLDLEELVKLPFSFNNITYKYLISLNRIIDHLIDVILNEFKHIKQIPTIEKFENHINDRIKTMNKKNSNYLTLPITQSITWDDIYEHGQYEISINIINKTFSVVLDLIEFVSLSGLPVDGKFFAHIFGLTFLFHKYCISYVTRKKNESVKIIFIQNISINIFKKLEKHFGNIVFSSIPYSLISSIIHNKSRIEELLLETFNRTFVFSRTYGGLRSKQDIVDILNIIIEFTGIIPQKTNILYKYNIQTDNLTSDNYFNSDFVELVHNYDKIEHNQNLFTQ